MTRKLLDIIILKMISSSKKSSGDFEKFKRNLKDAIDSFEKANEWADLNNCLQKVKRQFDHHQNTDIPLKKDLAKRLAQCLNPDLSVIHQPVLEIYSLIFQRQIEMSKLEDQSKAEWGSDLGLFLSGLFNFYQFAAFEVKDQFLNIIDQYILSFDKELLLSLPGFMICMLPALEDQNADKLKKVDDILRKTEQAVGTSEFYGEIWKAMLRTNRARLSAIKYLEKRIPRDLEAARELMKKDQIYISRHKIKVQSHKTKEGNLESRVSLERDVQREEMEKKHLALTCLEDYFYFYYPLKEKLVVNALLAGLADPSYYVNRAVLDFLITHAPITGKINKEIENVKLAEGALYTLQRRDYAFIKKFFTWTLGHLEEADEDYRPQESDPAIRILVPALKCLYQKFLDKNEIAKHTQKEKIQQSPQSIPILITTSLLNDSISFIEPILLQVSVDLIKYIKYYYDSKTRFTENVRNLFDLITGQMNCIWIALGDLLSKEINESKIQGSYSLEAIDLIGFCLSDLRQHFEKAEGDMRQHLRPLLSSLLSGVKKLSNGMNNLENVLPALDLIGNILQCLDKSKDEVDDLQGSVNNFNSFYIELCNAMIDDEPRELFKLDTYKKASQILTQIQEFSSIQQLNEMPQWMVSIINCSKTKRVKIALVSTETFLTILSKECTRQGDPVKKLQNLIVNSAYDSSSISNSGGSELLRSITPNRNIYQTLQETRNHHCTDIIKTLWYLLDEEEDHQKIVILLKKFDGLLPAIFSEVVINDLKDKAPREVKERGIKKFSIFWNLTAFDYPNYRPFYEKDTSDRRYGALHNVLHFLEQNDPTLRLSCRSWLSESKYFYNRILDPLLEEFLLNSKVFVTFTKQIFFYDMYDTKIVSENFGKLRNIILNTQDEMIKYMISNYTSDYIQRDFMLMFEWMLPKQNRLKQHKYLEIIVYITLQFIMGQAVESVDTGLYQESQTVNASACEFMELILKSLESHSDISNKIAHIIVDPILRTFKQVIDNQNHAMQVHLLNLLKVIFFECKFNDSKEASERIYNDPSLIDSIIKGMKNEVSFVRLHFIQFATMVMDAMKKQLKAVDFTRNVTKLIACFCDLMNHVDVSLFSQSATMAPGEEGHRRTSVALQETKSQGSLVINQESDIAQLLQGFKKILSNALSIYEEKPVKGMEGNMPTMIMDQVMDSSSTYRQAEGTSLFGKMSKLFGGGGDSPVIVVTDEQVIREAIYKEFKRIIIACLNCWNDLPIFSHKDFYFTRSGVFPYTNDDEKAMEKIMQNNYDKFKEQMNSISQMMQEASRSTQTREMVSSQQKSFTSAEYIKMKTNSIQHIVLDFLKPLSDTSSNQLIEGIILVWTDKKNVNSSNLMHKNLEKLMQILQSVRVKYYQVIECANNMVEKLKWKVTAPKSKSKLVLTLKIVQKDTLLCQFVYCYLLYNVQQLFTKGDEMSVPKLYKAVLRFVQNFKESKHPVTLCWLFEILNILAIKFSPTLAYSGDQKLKKEYIEVLSDLLTSVSKILSDGYQVKFEDNYGFLIAFPPHVYELLKRFSTQMSDFISIGISKPVASESRGGFTASQSLMQPQAQIKKPLTASGGGQMVAATVKKPGNQSQSKMQPLSAHNPPPEDVDEDDDLSSKSQIGIAPTYGLRLGHEKNPLNFMQTQRIEFPDQSEYGNKDFFSEEGNSTSSFMLRLAAYINTPQQLCPHQALIVYQRFFTLITLKGVLFTTVQSILDSATSHSSTEKIQASLKIVVDEVIKVLSQKEAVIVDKEKATDSLLDHVFLREVFTDFFASLMERGSMYLVSRYKQDISELFFSDTFFQTSRRNLRKWCKIINKFISYQSEHMHHKEAIFDDLLYKWNTQAGLLTSRETENKQKIIALKRVSFLVFSGDVDQYDDKLDILLRKMTEGLKMGANKKFPELQRQLFLLTRVLLLRLQTVTLTDALRKLWPHLLNELERIFRDRDTVAPKDKNKDKQEPTNLIFEAIKVVELMSALNLEDFQMNQWIFLVDSYGFNIDQQAQDGLSRKAQTNGAASQDHDGFQLLDKADSGLGGIFQPSILRFMPQSQVLTFHNQLPLQSQFKDSNAEVQHYVKDNLVTKQIELRRSSIQVDRNSYDQENVLETFALQIQMSLSLLNTERTEIDRQDFEALIEKDFIELESK